MRNGFLNNNDDFKKEIYKSDKLEIEIETNEFKSEKTEEKMKKVIMATGLVNKELNRGNAQNNEPDYVTQNHFEGYEMTMIDYRKNDAENDAENSFIKRIIDAKLKLENSDSNSLKYKIFEENEIDLYDLLIDLTNKTIEDKFSKLTNKNYKNVKEVSLVMMTPYLISAPEFGSAFCSLSQPKLYNFFTSCCKKYLNPAEQHFENIFLIIYENKDYYVHIISCYNNMNVPLEDQILACPIKISENCDGTFYKSDD